MENSLKQRIIGAVVLVALGVIFLPAILKEKTSNGVFETKIPEKPKVITEYKMDTHKIDDLLAQEKENAQKIEKEASEAKLKIEQTPEDKIITNKIVQSEQSQSTSETTLETTPKTKLKINEDKVSAVSVTEAKAGAWIIQVASFSNQENAIKLVSKLKTNGHKAYKNKVKVEKNTVYRVFVGPFIKKNKASNAVTNINKVAGIKSIIKVFNPIKH